MMLKLTKEKGEHAIAVVLRSGSSISTLIMAVGLGLILLRGTDVSSPAVHRLHLRAVLSNLILMDPRSLVEVGLLLLLLTPIFRIIVAAVSFAMERDYKYVLVSLVVLGVVLFSFVFAIEG